MATYSSILAWRIPWTEEPGGLRFRGSQRVGRNVTTEHTCLFLYAADLSLVICGNAFPVIHPGHFTTTYLRKFPQEEGKSHSRVWFLPMLLFPPIDV